MLMKKNVREYIGRFADVLWDEDEELVIFTRREGQVKQQAYDLWPSAFVMMSGLQTFNDG